MTARRPARAASRRYGPPRRRPPWPANAARCCGAHEVTNVMISGNPWIPVIYRAAPMTDVVTPGPRGRARGSRGSGRSSSSRGKDRRVRARGDGERARTGRSSGADDTREAGVTAAAAHPTRRRRAAPWARCGAARRARGSRAREVAFSGAASYAARGGQHEPSNASVAISLECEPVTRL